MIKVGVVYHSVCGTTKALAEAVVKGVNNLTGCEGIALAVEGQHIRAGRFDNQRIMAQLDECEAIVLGSPTFMGNVSAQFKSFIDAASDRYSELKWADKLAAGFTIGSNYSGDQLNTIQALQIFSSQMGMLWVPLDILPSRDMQGRNRGGCQLGLIAVEESGGGIHELDRLTAVYLGERVGRVVSRGNYTASISTVATLQREEVERV
ncbi:NAD(P)H dehydrogenase (quinone) [Microbulbifer sp. NBRC 101763]|uniref:flavodoxin family protein n=1 Tax=Microbulbifer sp. NBRC 101763 TaxID=1113820 RepID=UPI0030ABB65A